VIDAAVSLAGAGGAVARYVVDGWVQRRTDATVPLGTLVVNGTGSFLVGLLLGWAIGHGANPDVTLIAGTVFLGG
jgi:fluoride exporter